jgi:hypothetical protein
MITLAAVHSHRGLLWGIVLVAIGIAHLTFRGFYARRAQAIHDARQDTAPSLTRGFYRRHSAAWWSRWTIWGAAFLIALGAADIALHA